MHLRGADWDRSKDTGLTRGQFHGAHTQYTQIGCMNLACSRSHSVGLHDGQRREEKYSHAEPQLQLLYETRVIT